MYLNENFLQQPKKPNAKTMKREEFRLFLKIKCLHYTTVIVYGRFLFNVKLLSEIGF